MTVPSIFGLRGDRAMTGDRRARTGQRGEDLARMYLIAHGYGIVQTRWRPAPPLRGDIDIVARRDDMLVFVEVRTRRGRGDGIDRAYGSLGVRKQAHLVRLAYAYIAEHDLAEALWRIDGIAVAVDPVTGGASIDHTENLLDW